MSIMVYVNIWHRTATKLFWLKQLNVILSDPKLPKYYRQDNFYLSAHVVIRSRGARSYGLSGNDQPIRISLLEPTCSPPAVSQITAFFKKKTQREIHTVYLKWSVYMVRRMTWIKNCVLWALYRRLYAFHFEKNGL